MLIYREGIDLEKSKKGKYTENIRDYSLICPDFNTIPSHYQYFIPVV